MALDAIPEWRISRFTLGYGQGPYQVAQATITVYCEMVRLSITAARG